MFGAQAAASVLQSLTRPRNLYFRGARMRMVGADGRAHHNTKVEEMLGRVSADTVAGEKGIAYPMP